MLTGSDTASASRRFDDHLGNFVEPDIISTDDLPATGMGDGKRAPLAIDYCRRPR